MVDRLQHKSLIAALTGVLASTVVGILWLLMPGLLASWEWSTYDLRLRLRGPAPASPHIVLIGRDAESDARFGVGIWDRALFAKVIAALGETGAAVIAPDFHFAGASPPERGGAASDDALIQATQAATRVLYPLPVMLAAPGTSDLSQSPDPVLREWLVRHAPALDEQASGQLAHVTAIHAPLRPLVQASQGIGHMAALPDPDSVYRRVPAYVSLVGQALPAYGVAMAASYLHVAPERIVIRPGQAVVFPNARLPDGTVRTVALPIDRQGNLLVNYAGRWTEGPFPYFSFVDVWDAAEDGDLDALKAQVSGKIVLLLHASIEADKRRTPLELKAPGGFIHANVVNTILTSSALREASRSSQVLVTVLVALLSAWVVLSWPGWKGVMAILGLAAAYAGSASAALVIGQLVLPLLPPLFALVLAAGGGMTWASLLAGRRVERLEAEIQTVQTRLSAAIETLAERESAVERLEEELQAAQAEAAASTEKEDALARSVTELKRQLTQAEAEVGTSRQEIETLRAKLGDLMAATIHPVRLSSAELEQLRQECERVGILTQSPTVLAKFRDLKKAAPSLAPILLLGETGTGKELFAKAAHALSPRANGPFVAVNVSAISPELVESELFGHVQGAFTGATRDRRGFFEQADRGTIFLDEIGDLRHEMQAKLLRVLQDGTFYRVGGASPTSVDVRLITATNRELIQGVAQGWFREDLYFRLRGIELRLPPLRERAGDLPLLAERFVRETAARNGRSGLALSKGALDALQRWSWRGNIRELKACLEQAAVLAEGNLITEQDLRLSGSPLVAANTPGKVIPSPDEASMAQDVTGDAAVLACLRQHGFDMQATAQALGWDRSTVTQRLKGLCFKALVEHGGERRAAAEALAGTASLTRVVELKLNSYCDHLLKTMREFGSVDEALSASRKRFKNLPERHLPFLEAVIRQAFERGETGIVAGIGGIEQARRGDVPAQ